MTKTAPSTRVVTGRVRLSYVHLLEAHASMAGQEPKYSTVVLIPKTDTKTIDALRAAQQMALEAGKATKFNGKLPTSWVDTIHDGDTEADLERNPEYAGHLYMSVSSKTRPQIVDASLEPTTDVYSGCWARVSINAFPFNTSGNKGVSFGLNNVQKLADGEPLDGRTSAESDFADDGDLI